MTKYFKVKIGFKDDDFISIDETELRKAMIAQITGKIGIFNEGTIAGNSIISITPDYNKEMGWNRDYKLQGEDYDRIGVKRVEESRNLLETAKSQATGLTEIGSREDRSHLLTKPKNYGTTER